MYNMTKCVISVWLIVLCVVSPQAATVFTTPTIIDTEKDDIVVVDVWVDFRGEPTFGGGVNILFDNNKLEFLDYLVDRTFFFNGAGTFHNDYLNSYVYNSEVGGIENVGFFEYLGFSSVERLATFRFRVIDDVAMQISIVESPQNPFVDHFLGGGDSVDLGFRNTIMIDQPHQLGLPTVSPDRIDFGVLEIGQSEVRPIAIHASDTQSLALGSLSSLFSLDAPFSMINDNCSNTSIAPSSSCTVTVQYQPTEQSWDANALDIPQIDSINPLLVTLTGRTEMPRIEVLSQPFTIISELNSSNSEELIIGNIGEQPLDITHLSILGDSFQAFQIDSQNCIGTSLPPAQNCNVVIRYNECCPHVDDAELRVSSNDPFFSPLSVLLVGITSDSDNDGHDDRSDNCRLVANANQVDSDGDDFGNQCDPDFNNDCVVNFGDYALMTENFFSTTSPLYDLNSDGVVNFGDLGIFAQFFLGEPGPSELNNTCE